MKVLVTGAAGFLARHVALAFTREDHEVRLTDIRNVESRDMVVPADFTALSSALQITRDIDVVCHLGGVGDVYQALDDPVGAAHANVVGTVTLLEAALRNGVSKFVYASTWEVYGEPVYQPIDELHPCSPDHPYGITKLAGERLVGAYDTLKDLPTVALRLGTAYGTDMRPNSVFSIFIERAMKGEPITLMGSGEQTRQFTNAADIGRAFVLAADGPTRGEVFNVTASESVSIRTLAELVVREYNTEIVNLPARKGDVPPAEVSSEKARRQLGWEAGVPFEQGLLELIASYKK